MKAKITFIPDFFTSDDHSMSITVYGNSREALFKTVCALEKSDGVVVTNLFITDDVKDKSNDVQGKPEYETS